MKRNPVLYLIMAIVFLFLFPLGCAILLSSCASSKGKQEKVQQVAAVDSTTSGAVSESKTTVSTDWEWWRQTMLMQQPKAGDTIINRNYYTSHLPAPQVIIMEGGKGKQEAVTEDKDSAWNKRFARLEAMINEKSKEKETKPATMTQILLIVGAGILVTLLLVRLKLSIK